MNTEAGEKFAREESYVVSWDSLCHISTVVLDFEVIYDFFKSYVEQNQVLIHVDVRRACIKAEYDPTNAPISHLLHNPLGVLCVISFSGAYKENYWFKWRCDDAVLKAERQEFHAVNKDTEWKMTFQCTSDRFKKDGFYEKELYDIFLKGKEGKE